MKVAQAGRHPRPCSVGSPPGDHGIPIMISNWSLLHSEAQNLCFFTYIFAQVLSSTRPYQAHAREFGKVFFF